MILKIIKSFLPPECRDNERTSFFDGFDYVTKPITDLQYIESLCNAYPFSYFTEEKTEKVLELYLMRGEIITRYLAIDLSNTVYLMSDTGKTIEKLN